MPSAVSSERAHEPYENGYVTPREDHFETGGGFVRPTNRGHGKRHTDSISANGFFQAHDPDSLAKMISNARKDRCGKKIGIRDRICCYQWTWFTMTMATGGIANVFHSTSNLIQSAVSANEHPRFNFTPMAFCAVAVQGTGFLIAFMICAAFIYRLMTQKLPRDTQRPGVFISIGPSGFTVAGLVLLGQKAEVIVPASVGNQEHAVLILRIFSILMGLWFWGLSVWFFLVSVGSLWKYVRPEHSMPFQMTWWSFVFPNTALVTATLAMATALDSAGLRVFGCVMAACLTVVWLLVFITMLRCLWKRQLLWPKVLDNR
ncbi:hypothetical protein DL769_004840 [Monosporascus sp. CRB-8-3]|nr:hypothetical protein DL769_004840 [Monosporascus sp. CRB-8-3]